MKVIWDVQFKEGSHQICLKKVATELFVREEYETKNHHLGLVVIVNCLFSTRKYCFGINETDPFANSN